MDVDPAQLAGAIDYGMAMQEAVRRARVQKLGELLGANVPFQVIVQTAVASGESLETLLGDLLALGVRPELFVQELRNCREWLGQRDPSAQQAAGTLDDAMATFEARSAAINAQFAREQAQRDYNRWVDAQLARNWVLSFVGQSGDPVLRTYPGLYGA